jgi:hypothetical protein
MKMKTDLSFRQEGQIAIKVNLVALKMGFPMPGDS